MTWGKYSRKCIQKKKGLGFLEFSQLFLMLAECLLLEGNFCEYQFYLLWTWLQCCYWEFFLQNKHSI